MNIIIQFILKIFNKIYFLYLKQKIKYYEIKSGQVINFVPQGTGGVDISGDCKKIKISHTSHLKSNTFIECSGGVSIGMYFHPGKGLTIFSTNHNYNSSSKIPYDEISIQKSVVIKDFVWCGSNVTIVPGVTIGEGVVIGAGSVVTKNIPDYAVVGGNPATILKYRDINLFKKLKKEGKFF